MSPSFTRKAARQLVAEFQWTMPTAEKDGGPIPVYTGHANRNDFVMRLGSRHQSTTLNIGHKDSLAAIKFASIYPDLLLFEEAITNHQVLLHCHVTILHEKGKLKRREYKNVDQNLTLLGVRGRSSDSGKEASLKWAQVCFNESNTEGICLPLRQSYRNCLPIVKTRTNSVDGVMRH
ncbi:hypothetical protein SLS55_000590 [Diplodia seriata]|uniref:Uncharacterized protein n=1 Tax=Diplodia seriata TaxID=420778 RepID=A0ABR3CX92_9PEZI